MNKRILSIFFIIIAAGVVPASILSQTPEKEPPEKAAQRAAESWLDLVDHGQFDKTWEEASPSFKAVVGQDKWVRTLEDLRTHYGKVKDRKLKLARYTKSLPNAPAGEYVVVQFQTTFADNSSVIETVVPMLDPDGKWRVSGYFIKNAPNPIVEQSKQTPSPTPN